MSIMHYIAASKELPLGDYGKKKSKETNIEKIKKAIRIKSAEIPKDSVPLEQIMDLSFIKEDEIEVYDSIEDAAGIFIHSIFSWEDAVRKQFKNKFIYKVTPNFGNFILNDKIKSSDNETYKANTKCISALFDYIRRYICDNEEVEIYTCWAGEENKERNHHLNMLIELKTFSIGDSFELKERQYILIKV
ncbi:MAG: hypothetical protein JL50_01285 [Peptococcaceae bacterium BICA1-7]|nr:MAG: hypothetical protein JL50_01285 [Peptococcaceae bacterium BICA1-7]HBV97979.1 hypothetical protein [Desulfotomaculum sp.]